MIYILHPRFGNHILDAPPPVEASSVRRSLHRANLKARDILYPAGARRTRVYFPAGAVLSLLTVTRDGDAVEIGTFGREGFSGAQLVLGEDYAPTQLICQVAGEAHYMNAGEFLRHFSAGTMFRHYAQKYTAALFNFMGQAIACNRLHSVDERCAKRLLLTHDRVEADRFELTQEFLAMMLGVHRQGVSIAAARLQDRGFIRYRRGHVEIRNRHGLESAACECYNVSAYEFGRVLTAPGAQHGVAVDF